MRFMFRIIFLASKKEAFASVGSQLMTVQACALLEIVHPLFGWVKTGALMPFLQVTAVRIKKTWMLDMTANR